MVKSSDVGKVLELFTDGIDKYNEEVSSWTDGIWQGASRDNLVSQASDFVSESNSTLKEQINAFMDACDLYAKYVEKKKLRDENQKLYDSAAAKLKNLLKNASISDLSEIAKCKYQKDQYNRLVDKHQNQMDDFTAKIDEDLRKCTTSISSSNGAVDVGALDIKGLIGTDFVTEEIKGEIGSYLKFDKDLIFNVLGQQGAAQCGVYSCAYGYTLLEGKCRISGSHASNWQVANAYNGGKAYATCYWSTMGLNYEECSSSERMNRIWEEVAEKHKPVMVTVQGSSENHFVLVVGFKKGATKKNLSAHDLVILDPAMSGSDILCYYGQGYKDNFNGSTYGTDIITFPDKK